LAPLIEYPNTVHVALELMVTVIGTVAVVEATVQYLNSHVASGLGCTHWNLWVNVRPGDVTPVTTERAVPGNVWPFLAATDWGERFTSTTRSSLACAGRLIVCEVCPFWLALTAEESNANGRND
jgi:hypothetical protein